MKRTTDELLDEDLDGHEQLDEDEDEGNGGRYRDHGPGMIEASPEVRTRLTMNHRVTARCKPGAPCIQLRRMINEMPSGNVPKLLAANVEGTGEIVLGYFVPKDGELYQFNFCPVCGKKAEYRTDA